MMTISKKASAQWAMVLLLQCLIVSPLFASAGLNEPQRIIQQVSDGLMQVLREDRTLLKTDPAFVHRLVDELFLPHVDLARVSALALGPYWREATPEQRRQFQAEFQRLLIQTYASALDSLSAWEVRFLPMSLAPDVDRTIVRTEVKQPGGQPIRVDYRMARVDGRWRAYDVAVQEISLLASYRSQFTAVVQSRGLDGLLAELSERNATRR
ncbi:MAG: ABC transporter substrate-binding protein [Sphingobacteriia bacterium]|nr:ABC transporter substrate-binding protein [Sphingobacteriia bacterium]NCC38618.1 ABC transporter substrate-binding protein [Gammaproteobacteria bacterium]